METVESPPAWPFRGRPSKPPSLIGLAVACGLALLIVIALIAYRSIVAFEESARWVSHTYAVMSTLGQVQGTHDRMRLAWRGYLIGGSPEALEDFRKTGEVLREQVTRIQALTAENARQQVHVGSLGAAIAEDLAAAETSIAQKSAGALEDSSAILAVLEAMHRSADRFAGLSEGIEAQERTLLASQELETAMQGAAAKRWIAIGSAASLAALALAFWLLRRAMARTSLAQARAERYAHEVEDLYNQAPCGYHSVDLNGVFRRINDTELAMLGYSREEIVGRMRHPDLMTPESAALYERHLEDFVRTGVVHGAEFTYRRKDGSTFIAQADATAVRGNDGSIVESRTALIDITDRIKAQSEARNLTLQLREYSARLEGINKELESFSYSVSHDLRAPLRAINGFALMLDEDYRDRLDPEGRRLLGVVRANAESMARLIDDLLAFSRLGKTALVSAPVDMNVLVREVLTESGNVSAELRIGALPQAHGDRALLKQVWANLIGNAIKYSANAVAPVVTISGGETPNGDCEYRVADNGAGFDMRYYDKLFGVFQRLHSASEFPGTGVGLAIVHRIVTRHGGRVWAEGQVGSGAVFHFTLGAGTANG
jgi:PAS domain S-box-containing protein